MLFRSSATNNFTRGTCQHVALPNTPIGAAVPSKLKIIATGKVSRFYCIDLPPGASATMRVNPMLAGDDWDLFVTDEFSATQSSQLGHGLYDLIDQPAGTGLNGQGQTFTIEVRPFSFSSALGIFTLDFDRY